MTVARAFEVAGVTSGVAGEVAGGAVGRATGAATGGPAVGPTGHRVLRIHVVASTNARDGLLGLGCSKAVAARVFASGRLLRRDVAAVEAGAVEAGATGGWSRLSAGTPLAVGDELVLELAGCGEGPSSVATHLPGSTGISGAAAPVTVVYEDDFLLMAEKPAGLLVHGDGTGAETLTDRVAARLAAEGVSACPQAVQRLDVETTGLVLFSLTEEFQPALDALVAGGELPGGDCARGVGDGLADHRAMRKRYLAVVEGRYPAGERIISAPIGRDRHDARLMRISASGKPAVTRVAQVAEKDGRSLLLVELETGRRHQIRVHLAHQGFPITGDGLYGNAAGRVPRGAEAVPGLMLHAWRETFDHPVTGERLDVRTAWPPRFSELGFSEVTGS